MANFCRDLCEGIVGNCRNCMTAPITRTKIYWFSGILVVIILIIIIICVSVPSGSPSPSGKDALSKGLASGLYYLAPDTGEKSTVKDFNKEIFNTLATNKIRLQVVGAQADCAAQYKDVVPLALDQVEFIGRLLANVSTLAVAMSADDVQKAFNNGKISTMISLVGGHGFDNRLALLRVYHGMGVRVMTLVTPDCSTPWGKAANDISATTIKFDPFGKAIVKELNRLGILIDIAGADVATQKAILDASEAPVVAIGVGLRSINPSLLNLDSNEVVSKFIEKDGLLMLSTDCDLITANKQNCTADDFTTLLKTAKGLKMRVGIGGSINKNSKELKIENWETYFNKLYDSNEFSLDDLRGLAKDNFMNTLRKVEKVSKTLTIAPIGEEFFDWTQLPADKKACYTYNPTPTVTPAPQPTPAPTQPTPAPTQPTPAPTPPTPAPSLQPTPAPTTSKPK